jgi:hypothetical protein
MMWIGCIFNVLFLGYEYRIFVVQKIDLRKEKKEEVKWN